MAETRSHDESLLTVDEAEASRILGLSLKTLQKRRWQKKGPRYLKLGRRVAYRLSDLRDFLDSSPVLPAQEA